MFSQGLNQSLWFPSSPAVPELYEDATKRFSAEYVFKQEATITEPVARLVLSPGNSAFALLESSLQLAKFALPPADDKVKFFVVVVVIKFVYLGTSTICQHCFEHSRPKNICFQNDPKTEHNVQGFPAKKAGKPAWD